jgi:Rieske Fe-S protein
MVLIKPPNDEKKEAQIDKLKDDFIEMQQKVSELRKSGKYTKIAELIVLDIPSKIKMAQITQEDKDISAIQRSIKDIREEVNLISRKSEFDLIHSTIKEAFENLRKDEKKKAIEKYNEIMKIYPLLTKSLKKTVYSACIELKKRLS